MCWHLSLSTFWVSDKNDVKCCIALKTFKRWKSLSDDAEFMCLNDLASIQQFLARKKEKEKALINVPIARMFRQKKGLTICQLVLFFKKMVSWRLCKIGFDFLDFLWFSSVLLINMVWWLVNDFEAANIYGIR